MRRRTVALLALVVVFGAYLLAGGVDPNTADRPPETVETVEDDALLRPVDNSSTLWPYTSRSPSVRDRTLAINLIVHGSPAATRRALTDRSERDWQGTNGTTAAAGAEHYRLTGDEWGETTGSTRYTYIDTTPDDGAGEWVEPRYQLHVGSYFGSRYHIRAYSAGDDWTALQAHQEYFDWFRLRHTVTNIDDAARAVEGDFIGQPAVDSVSRTYYGLEGGWSDGWISEIGLAAALLLTIGPPGSRRLLGDSGRTLGRWALRNRSGFLLAAGLAGLILGVRAAGIVLEPAVPGSPQLLAGALYPLLVVGPPALVALLAPRLEGRAAFGFTLVGLGAGFVYDFAAIGLGVLPVSVVLHRLGLVTALGLFAVAVVDASDHRVDTIPRLDDAVDADGRARENGRWPRRGLHTPVTLLAGGGWLLGLALPLIGYV